MPQHPSPAGRPVSDFSLFSPTAPITAPSEHNIEPHIFGLVARMDCLPGVRTLWSCQGHPGRSGAFVVFSAAPPFARLLSILLLPPPDGAGDPPTDFAWRLHGHWVGLAPTQWHLETADRRIPGGRLFGRFSRTALDRDFDRIAGFCERVSTLVTRDKGEFPCMLLR